MTVRELFVSFLVYDLEIRIIEPDGENWKTLDTVDSDKTNLFLELVNHKKDYEDRKVDWVSVNKKYVSVCLKPEEKK